MISEVIVKPPALGRRHAVVLLNEIIEVTQLQKARLFGDLIHGHTGIAEKIIGLG